MPRRRAPLRFDQLVDAATDVFIREGFARARMERIAREAHSATGTVYLYVEGKEALFDLALRRALEDPTALVVPTPAPQASRDDVLDRFQGCLQAACHLPQLWLASEHPDDFPSATGLDAILRELWQWLARYRRAILMVRASASDWPGLAQRLDREFHQETVRRLAAYLERRSGLGLARPMASATARFILVTLAASALGLGLAGEATDRVPGALDEDAAVRVVSRGVAPREGGNSEGGEARRPR